MVYIFLFVNKREVGIKRGTVIVYLIIHTTDNRIKSVTSDKRSDKRRQPTTMIMCLYTYLSINTFGYKYYDVFSEEFVITLLSEIHIPSVYTNFM